MTDFATNVHYEDMASVVVHSDPFTKHLVVARFPDGRRIVNAFYRSDRPQPDG